jgi:hypothetical protein
VTQRERGALSPQRAALIKRLTDLKQGPIDIRTIAAQFSLTRQAVYYYRRLLRKEGKRVVSIVRFSSGERKLPLRRRTGVQQPGYEVRLSPDEHSRLTAYAANNRTLREDLFRRARIGCPEAQTLLRTHFGLDFFAPPMRGIICTCTTCRKRKDAGI